MDSRKPLTAGEIEELKEEIRTMPHKEFFGENLQPRFQTLLRGRWAVGKNDLICDNCGNEDQSDFAPNEDGKPVCGNCGWQRIRTRREVEEQERVEAERSDAENRIKADLARVEPEEW